MQPQKIERRVERLEGRVTILEQLPARVEGLASQILQLRTEMRAEFSAVRENIQAGDEETRRALRDEIRAGDEETRRALRDEIRAGEEETRRVLRNEFHAIGDQIMSQARTLYEDMRGTIKLLEEGRSSSYKPRRSNQEGS
jgi:hypothetical protein